MTKQEFIQEAALRYLTAFPEMGKGYICDSAADLADELWTHFEEQQPTETENVDSVPTNESVHVLAKEIARLDKEMVDKKNAEYKEKGWYCHYQKSGADIRFLNACNNTHGGYKKIETIADLLDEGCFKFERRPMMGRKTMELVNMAIESLYGIKSW